MPLTPEDKTLIKEHILALSKTRISNAEALKEMREVKALLKEANNEWIDTNKAANLLNSKNPRLLQKLRDGGYLKDKIDYYHQGKGFMYRKEKLVEIRNQIISGQFKV